jgi:hypothetical protein
MYHLINGKLRSNREKLIDDCFSKIEMELELLGATAIEDKL